MKKIVLVFILIASAALIYPRGRSAFTGVASSPSSPGISAVINPAPTSAIVAPVEEKARVTEARHRLQNVFAQGSMTEVFAAAADVLQYPDLSEQEISALAEGICRFSRTTSDLEAFRFETLRLRLTRALGQRPLPDCPG